MANNVRIDYEVTGASEVRKLAEALAALKIKQDAIEQQFNQSSQSFQRATQSIDALQKLIEKLSNTKTPLNGTGLAIEKELATAKSAVQDVANAVTNLSAQRIKLQVDDSQLTGTRSKFQQFERDLEAARQRSDKTSGASNPVRDILVRNANGLTREEAQRQLKEAEDSFEQVKHLREAAIVNADPEARATFLPRKHELEQAQSRLRDVTALEAFLPESASHSVDALSRPLRRLDSGTLEASNDKLREQLAAEAGGEQAVLALRKQELELIRQKLLGEAKNTEEEERVNRAIDHRIQAEQNHTALTEELRLREQIASAVEKSQHRATTLESANAKLEDKAAVDSGGEQAALGLRKQRLEALRQEQLALAQNAEQQNRINAAIDREIAAETNHAGLQQDLKLREEIADIEERIGKLAEKSNQSTLSGVQKIEAERAKALKQIDEVERRASTAGKSFDAAKARTQINTSFDIQRREEEQPDFRARRGLSGNALQTALYGLQSPRYAAFSAVSGLAGALPAAGVAAGIGVLAVGALGKAMFDLTRSEAQAAHELDNFRNRLGLTLGQAGELSNEAKIVGVNIGTLEQSARQLSAGLEDSAGQGKKAADALHKLGVDSINPTTLDARDMGAVLNDVIEKLSAIKDPAERALLSQRLLGRGAKEIEPLIDAHQRLKESLHSLGLEYDESVIQELKKADEEFNTLGVAIDLLRANLAKPLGKIVIPIVRQLTEELGKSPGELGQDATELFDPLAAAGRIGEKVARFAVPGLAAAEDGTDRGGAEEAERQGLAHLQGKQKELRPDFDYGRSLLQQGRDAYAKTLEGKQLQLRQVETDLATKISERERGASNTSGADPLKAAALNTGIAQQTAQAEQLKREIKGLEKQNNGRDPFGVELDRIKAEARKFQFPASEYGRITELQNELIAKLKDYNDKVKEGTYTRAQANELAKKETANINQDIKLEKQRLFDEARQHTLQIADIGIEAGLKAQQRKFRTGEALAKINSRDPEGDPQLIEQAFQNQLAENAAARKTRLTQNEGLIPILRQPTPQEARAKARADQQAEAKFIDDNADAEDRRAVALAEIEKRNFFEAKKNAEELGHIRAETEAHGYQLQIEHAEHLAELTRDRESPNTALERAYETQKKLAQLAYDFETRENAVTFRDDPEKRKIEDEKARQRLIEDGQRAEYEREEKLAVLRKQERDASKAAAGSLYDAIRGGSKGLHDFFKNQADIIGRNAFSALLGPTLGSISKGIDPTGQGILHDLLQGGLLGGSTGAPRLRPDQEGPIAAIPAGQALPHPGFFHRLADAVNGVPANRTAPLITPSAEVQAGVLAHPEQLAAQGSQIIGNEALEASIKQLSAPATLTGPGSEITTLIPHLDPVRTSLDTLRVSVDANTNAIRGTAGGNERPPVQQPPSASSTGGVPPALSDLQAHSLVHSSRNAVTAANKLANTPNEPVTANVDTNTLIDALKQPKPPINTGTSPHGFATLGELASSDVTGLRGLFAAPQASAQPSGETFPVKPPSLGLQVKGELPSGAPRPKSLATSFVDGFAGTEDITSGPPLIPRYLLDIPAEERAKASEAFNKGQYGQSAAHAIASIPGTGFVSDVYGGQVDLARRGIGEIQSDHEVVGGIHALASAVPLLGANSVSIADDILSGDANRLANALGELSGYGVAGKAPLVGVGKFAEAAKAHPLVTSTVEASKNAKTALRGFAAHPLVEGLHGETGLFGPGAAQADTAKLPTAEHGILPFAEKPAHSTLPISGESAASFFGALLPELPLQTGTSEPAPKLPSLGLHVTGEFPTQTAQPNVFQRIGANALAAVNPVPAIREYLNRPTEIAKLDDALAAYQEQDRSGKPLTAPQKARIEAAMNVNLPTPEGNLLSEQASPLVKAGTQIGQGDFTGATGTVIGSAAPFIYGKALASASALPELAHAPLAQSLLEEEGSIGARAERALAAYNPFTQAKRDIANQTERELSQALGIPQTTDNAPFDLQNEKYGIEVKALIDNKRGAITIRKDALERKQTEVARAGIQPYTVAVDKRGAKPEYYYRQGLGSFRIGAMEKVPSLAALRHHLFDETGSIGSGSGRQIPNDTRDHSFFPYISPSELFSGDARNISPAIHPGLADDPPLTAVEKGFYAPLAEEPESALHEQFLLRQYHELPATDTTASTSLDKARATLDAANKALRLKQQPTTPTNVELDRMIDEAGRPHSDLEELARKAKRSELIKDSPNLSGILPGAFQFFSPNEAEGLSFAEAQKRLDSAAQIQALRTSTAIDKQLGLKSTGTGAIGDWMDGAENSIFNTISGTPSYDAVRYSAALKGELAHQESVIPFEVQKGGPDSVYRVTLPNTTPEQARSSLDAHGLQYRTLIPQGKDTNVVLFDKGTQLADKIEGFADEHDVEPRQYRGRGEFLGGDTREEGHRAYESVINEYQKKTGARLYGRGPGALVPDASGRSVTSARLPEEAVNVPAAKPFLSALLDETGSVGTGSGHPQSVKTLYHGSPRTGLTELLPSQGAIPGAAVYASDDPKMAAAYTGSGGRQVYSLDTELTHVLDRDEAVVDEAVRSRIIKRLGNVGLPVEGVTEAKSGNDLFRTTGIAIGSQPGSQYYGKLNPFLQSAGIDAVKNGPEYALTGDRYPVKPYAPNIGRTDPVISALERNTDATKGLTDAVKDVTPGGGIGPNPLAQNPLPSAAIAAGAGEALPELPGPSPAYAPSIVLPEISVPGSRTLQPEGAATSPHGFATLGDVASIGDLSGVFAGSPTTIPESIAPSGTIGTQPTTNAASTAVAPMVGTPRAFSQQVRTAVPHIATFAPSLQARGAVGQVFQGANTGIGILDNIQVLRGLLSARHARQQASRLNAAYHNLPIAEQPETTLPNLDVPTEQAGLSPSGFPTLPQNFASIGDISNQPGILSNGFSDQSVGAATEGQAGQFGGLPGALAFAEPYSTPALGTLGSESTPLPNAPPFATAGAEGPASISPEGVPTFTALGTTTAPPEEIPPFISLPSAPGFSQTPELSSVPPAIDQQIRTAYSDLNAGSTSIVPQSVLDAANPFNNPSAGLHSLTNAFSDLTKGFGVGGLGPESGSSGDSSGGGFVSTPISRLFGLGGVGKDKKGSTQQVGDIFATGATVGAGIEGLLAGLHQGGAKGDLGATASVLGTAAALDPEPISKAILGIGAGITAAISSLFPDPRAQRQKQLTQELFNQKIAAEPFNQPGINVEESATGRAVSSDYLGNLRVLNARPLVSTIQEAVGFQPLHGDRVVTAPVRQVGLGPLFGPQPTALPNLPGTTAPITFPNAPVTSRDLSPVVNAFNPMTTSVRSSTVQDSARQDGPQQQTPPFSMVFNNTFNQHAIDSQDIMRRGPDIATAIEEQLRGTHRIARTLRDTITQT